MTIEQRFRNVDLAAESATVSMAGLTNAEIELVEKLCIHFDLKLGTRLRRAAAVEIIGGTDSAIDRLREAGQHLIYEYRNAGEVTG